MIKTVIVEDDPMVAQINHRYLEKVQGFELIQLASSVEEAVPAIKNQEVDLILLDIYMPGEDGWTLLSQIRGLGKEIDIIIISAACDSFSIQKGMRYGVVDYLIKPFEFERFRCALTKYKEEITFIHKQDQISQGDLDNYLFRTEQQTNLEFELPKGLSKNTLNKTWLKIVEKQGVVFSTEEMAHEVGISRVSMRKYLFFLADIHIIETDIVYGKIGRPIYKHRMIDLNDDLIKPYIGNS